MYLIECCFFIFELAQLINVSLAPQFLSDLTDPFCLPTELDHFEIGDDNLVSKPHDLPPVISILTKQMAVLDVGKIEKTDCTSSSPLNSLIPSSLGDVYDDEMSQMQENCDVLLTTESKSPHLLSSQSTASSLSDHRRAVIMHDDNSDRGSPVIHPDLSGCFFI